MENKLNEISKEIDNLKRELNLKNFSSSQDFDKYCRFNTRLKVPHYNQIPAVGEVGEILEVDGKLYICQSPNIFIPV